MSENLLSQDANICVKVSSRSAAANRFLVELVLTVPLNSAANLRPSGEFPPEMQSRQHCQRWKREV